MPIHQAGTAAPWDVTAFAEPSSANCWRNLPTETETVIAIASGFGFSFSFSVS
jgi:hypothetical protein